MNRNEAFSMPPEALQPDKKQDAKKGPPKLRIVRPGEDIGDMTEHAEFLADESPELPDLTAEATLLTPPSIPDMTEHARMLPPEIPDMSHETTMELDEHDVEIISNEEGTKLLKENLLKLDAPFAGKRDAAVNRAEQDAVLADIGGMQWQHEESKSAADKAQDAQRMAMEKAKDELTAENALPQSIDMSHAYGDHGADLTKMKLDVQGDTVILTPKSPESAIGAPAVEIAHDTDALEQDFMERGEAMSAANAVEAPVARKTELGPQDVEAAKAEIASMQASIAELENPSSEKSPAFMENVLKMKYGYNPQVVRSGFSRMMDSVKLAFNPGFKKLRGEYAAALQTLGDAKEKIADLELMVSNPGGYIDKRNALGQARLRKVSNAGNSGKML